MNCSIDDCDRAVAWKGVCQFHYDQAYREANREKLSAQKRAYREDPANREGFLRRQRAYRETHRERIRARDADYRAANPEKVRAAVDRFRTENPEGFLAIQQKWRGSNPEKVRAYYRRYRALKLRLFMDEYTDNQVLARTDGRCHLCLKPLTASFHVDHVIPLDLEGPDGLANVVPAHKRCNQIKSNRACSAVPEIWSAATAAYLAFHGQEFSGPNRTDINFDTREGQRTSTTRQEGA